MPGRKTGSRMPRRARGYRRRGNRKARIGINPSYTAPKNFTETILFKDIVSNPGLSVGNGTSYDLSLVPEICPNLNGILAQMYRQYCVRGVKIMYIPAYNQYPATTGVAFAPRVYFSEDKTSATVDNSTIDVTRILTQDNVKTFSAFRTWSTYVKFPKPLLLTGAENDVPGGFMNFIPAQTPANKPLWLTLQKQTQLDTELDGGLTIPHLIGRMSCDGNNSSVGITLGRLYYKVYYSCKEQQQSLIPDNA